MHLITSIVRHVIETLPNENFFYAAIKSYNTPFQQYLTLLNGKFLRVGEGGSSTPHIANTSVLVVDKGSIHERFIKKCDHVLMHACDVRF